VLGRLEPALEEGREKARVPTHEGRGRFMRKPERRISYLSDKTLSRVSQGARGQELLLQLVLGNINSFGMEATPDRSGPRRSCLGLWLQCHTV
jgi:hypothetical protein